MALSGWWPVYPSLRVSNRTPGAHSLSLNPSSFVNRYFPRDNLGFSRMPAARRRRARSQVADESTCDAPWCDPPSCPSAEHRACHDVRRAPTNLSRVVRRGCCQFFGQQTQSNGCTRTGSHHEQDGCSFPMTCRSARHHTRRTAAALPSCNECASNLWVLKREPVLPLSRNTCGRGCG